jgi:hypothetical protein
MFLSIRYSRYIRGKRRVVRMEKVEKGMKIGGLKKERTDA